MLLPVAGSTIVQAARNALAPMILPRSAGTSWTSVTLSAQVSNCGAHAGRTN